MDVHSTMFVTKRDGTKEPVYFDKITKIYADRALMMKKWARLCGIQQGKFIKVVGVFNGLIVGVKGVFNDFEI